ncbi:MAG: NADH-quinone oxidoreductase subunit J [Propionibacteriaceae bacterium]|uniref:NADH-quinone oxidoreductase subunit J n=1 Tax=Propionibacterium ruminifibrarum TaxID=1962131 RepID=A0A375I2D4_9ACTN|nr:NADH-quinone oxidoreductase subunit J [Propionibacterium ruminifibrarum]MBE6477505.1 NADH-quinone oxidoreductase subunit J [Propionibacteriaceae bacterium]SPF68815.1 NADH:ubiquinone reductase (H+-translocating) [Propionibacterium ruminifibrarum]
MIPLLTAQAVAFWVFAVLAVAAALGLVLSRKPVHSALCLAAVMVCLACLYASLDAPFLFVAQIIVYTGAVMMLFVFTMMIIGVDSVDAMVETIKGQRIAATIGAAALLVLLVLAVGHGIITEPAGLDEAVGQAGNVRSLAYLVFGRYVFAFEATAALLITAALAAMVLSHGERLRKKERQKARAARRTREYAEQGVDPAPLPNPGVYARHNSADHPALLPDGSVAEGSVVPTLAARGVVVVDRGRLVAPNIVADETIRAVKDEQHGLLPGENELRDPGPAAAIAAAADSEAASGPAEAGENEEDER